VVRGSNRSAALSGSRRRAVASRGMRPNRVTRESIRPVAVIHQSAPVAATTRPTASVTKPTGETPPLRNSRAGTVSAPSKPRSNRLSSTTIQTARLSGMPIARSATDFPATVLRVRGTTSPIARVVMFR